MFRTWNLLSAKFYNCFYKNDVENISNNNTLTKMAILEHHDEARLCVTLMTCTQFVISIIALDFSFSDLLTM